MKYFTYFQGDRFYILGLQDILSMGNGLFVYRCGGISLGQWQLQDPEILFVLKTFEYFNSIKEKASHSVSLKGPYRRVAKNCKALRSTEEGLKARGTQGIAVSLVRRINAPYCPQIPGILQP